LPAHIRQPCTVRDLFTYALDLRGMAKKSLLRVMAEHCSATRDKMVLYYLCSRHGTRRSVRRAGGGGGGGGAALLLAHLGDVRGARRCGGDLAGAGAYNALRLARPTLLDLLAALPSCDLPLGALCEHGMPLQPRPYTVTVAPEDAPAAPTVAFNVVHYTTGAGATVPGLCTTWLDDLIAAAVGRKLARYLPSPATGRKALHVPNIRLVGCALDTRALPAPTAG